MNPSPLRPPRDPAAQQRDPMAPPLLSSRLCSLHAALSAVCVSTRLISRLAERTWAPPTSTGRCTRGRPAPPPSGTWTPAAASGCPPPRSAVRASDRASTSSGTHDRLPTTSATSNKIKGVSRTRFKQSPGPPPREPPADRGKSEWMHSSERERAIETNERAIYRNFGAFMGLTILLLFACDWKIRRDERLESVPIENSAQANSSRRPPGGGHQT